MNRLIWRELRSHAPFTLFGALTAIAATLVLVLARVDLHALKPLFEGFHAVHVLLSAIVTTAMYRRYRRNLFACILIGYLGSVGIATLSDVVFPHHGGALMLKATGADVHMHFHLPVIEMWWLINPAAVAGIAIALYRPTTRVPHTGHVLLSTWASLFYLLTNAPGSVRWLPLLPLVTVVLFVAVWLPCCVSDIIYPLLFVGEHAEPEHHHEHG